MPAHKTIPVEKVCPICNKPFAVCPPGKASRYFPPNETEFCCTEHAWKGRYRHGSVCKTLSLQKAVYLAGFMDGEGSIILHRRIDTKNVSLRVSVSNTNLASVERIRDMAGIGSIVSQRKSSKLHKIGHQWQLNSDAAVSFLEQIIPYLFTKKNQAELAIEFWKGMRDPRTKSNIQWQADCLEKMRSMNKRGPKV